MSDQDPFDLGDPQGATAKRRFGELSMAVNKVKLVSGASYSVPGVNNKDGDPFEFKGKQLTTDPASLRHVVLILECEKQGGELYNAFAHFLWKEKEEEYKVTVPTLQKVFGPKLAGLAGKKVSVEIEEVEIPNGEYAARRAWKVIRKFANAAERKAASEAYFASFRGGDAATGTGDVSDAQTQAPNGNGKGPGEWSLADWQSFKPEVVKHYTAQLEAATGAPAMKAKKALEATAQEFGVTPDDVKAVVA